MNVLVTGGAGYVGSVLVSYLLSHKCCVTVLDSLLYGGEGLLGVYDHPNFKFIHGDIRDTHAVGRSLEGADTVIHLAALVGETLCDRDHAESFDVNAAATKDLIDQSVSQGVDLFMLASTCSVYGSSPDQLLNERSSVSPNSVYALSKVRAENVVLARDDIDVVVMRFATAYGLSPRMRFDVMVNDFVLTAFNTGNLLIYSPDAYRPFVHVRDIAGTIGCLVYYRDRINSRVVNVGGTNITKGDLGKLVQLSVPGVHLSIKNVASRRDYRVDFSLLESVCPMNESLGATIRNVYDVLQYNLLDPTNKRYRNA